MAIRKTVEEEIVVSGSREDWLDKCTSTLEKNGFTQIIKSKALYQIEANYKKFTIWGSIQVALMPVGSDTKIKATATANVDNIYALFKSPGKTVLAKFKEGLQ
jgi:hypothetical protein